MEEARAVGRPAAQKIGPYRSDSVGMTCAPIVSQQIHRMPDLLDLRDQPVSIRKPSAREAGGNRRAESRWRQQNDVLDAAVGQRRKERLPPCSRFRVSVDEDLCHCGCPPCYNVLQTISG